MKKLIIPLICILILSTGVFSWSSVRSIEGNVVSVTLTPDLNDLQTFTVEETDNIGKVKKLMVQKNISRRTLCA